MLQPSSSSAQRRIYQAALRLFGEKGIQHVSVKELAENAGVARGTIYNHVESIEALFEDVAETLSAEMNQRLILSFRQLHDPDLRLAVGIRLYIKRAHDDPDWGLFVSRFGFHSTALRRLGASQPIQILMDGIQSNRYNLNIDQLSACIAMLTSSVLGAMYLVRDGLRTWRDAGSDCAELVLRALGVPSQQARQLATTELPMLAEQESISSLKHFERPT